ncbi:MAG: LysM peptidoglycan-binding domain-containing protein [Flavobacteriales bacterium]|jgi:LysM repeat protein|nr:LysM peptidoglycan-binding domain-containing protein [Flavobacteriales bacterium]
MNKFWLLLLAVFFTFGLQAQESIPDRFINHKVKKKETLYSLSQKYGVTVDQIEAYNPTLIKSRLKLKMTLRIPVYEAPVVIEEVISETESYLVPPKATKWRIAYTYGITIQELEALNPSLKEGLKAGQTLQVPITTKDTLVGPSSAFNYYTVLPKEGYYRIEKKLGIGQRILDSLNPELAITGLQAGMVLKVPLEFSGDLKVQDDLLVPKVDLLDSLSPLDRALKIGLLLPFKAQTLELDSLEKTKSLLKKRNLTRLAFDFYAGVRMALEVLAEKGVATELQVFDTQNKRAKLNQLVQTSELTAQDLLVGPLIPRNFDFISAQGRLRKIPKVAPLSYKKVQMRANVYQSIPPKQILRERMLSHLDNVLTEEENVVVVADSLNRDIEKILMERYPYAIRFRPEQGGYLDSELMDSLLLDSIPNKIILESENFSLISSISSQLSGKITPSRPIQLFTTFRGTAYENPNSPNATFGSLGFTFTSGYHPKVFDEGEMPDRFLNRFGMYPSKEAKRGYDLMLDLLLRITRTGDLREGITLGETDYVESRFDYQLLPNGAAVNQGVYLLQHQDDSIILLKK